MCTIRVSNSLDPDQARQFDGLDLGPNCKKCKGYQQTTKSPIAGKELTFSHTRLEFPLLLPIMPVPADKKKRTAARRSHAGCTSIPDIIVMLKLECAVDGVPSQIRTLKFLTPSTPQSHPGA